MIFDTVALSYRMTPDSKKAAKDIQHYSINLCSSYTLAEWYLGEGEGGVFGIFRTLSAHKGCLVSNL